MFRKTVLLVSVFGSLCVTLASKNSTSKAKQSEEERKELTPFEVTVNSSSFIDRSLLIEELLRGGHVLITAPSGFGKSVNLDMMRMFLDVEMDEHYEPTDELMTMNTPVYRLFAYNGLNIVRNRSFFLTHFRRYPVMYLDYSPLCQIKTYENMMVALRKIIRAAYVRFKFLTKITEIWYSEGEINVFKKFTNVALSKKLDKYDLKFGFEFLPEMIFRHFRLKTFILIDDYDTYLKIFLDKKLPDADEILGFIRSLNKILLLDNEYLEKAILTGETFDMETLESSLRYVKIKNVFYDDTFSKYYGLTEEEQDRMLESLQNSGEREKAKTLCEEVRLKIEEVFGSKKLWSFYGYKHQTPMKKLYGFKPVLHCLKLGEKA